VCFGVADRPVSLDLSASFASAGACAGPKISDAELHAAAAEAAADLADNVVTTAGDVHGSADYRRHLLRVLAARELCRAYRNVTRSDHGDNR
jgi:carbon-monoxide dehydrogenase medium subunit